MNTVNLPSKCLKHRLRLGAFLALFCLTTTIVADERQLIEVRVYRLGSQGKAELFDRMMKSNGLPALKQCGVEPVGVFEPRDEAEEDGDAVLRYVIAPFASPKAFAQISDQLSEPSLWLGADKYLDVPKSDPVFSRIDSSLLKGFSGMPRLQVPGQPQAGKKRLFELRIYESHSELKGKMKVEMFNDGELDIFKKVGLNSVFFGEALVAKNLPNLTYMVVHDDDEAMQQAWQRFMQHPDWIRMRAMDQYQDTVSKIIKRFLIPLDYSQIQ